MAKSLELTEDGHPKKLVNSRGEINITCLIAALIRPIATSQSLLSISTYLSEMESLRETSGKLGYREDSQSEQLIEFASRSSLCCQSSVHTADMCEYNHGPGTLSWASQNIQKNFHM